MIASGRLIKEIIQICYYCLWRAKKPLISSGQQRFGSGWSMRGCEDLLGSPWVCNQSNLGLNVRTWNLGSMVGTKSWTLLTVHWKDTWLPLFVMFTAEIIPVTGTSSEGLHQTSEIHLFLYFRGWTEGFLCFDLKKWRGWSNPLVK